MSFEGRELHKFPTFAFCDIRGYNEEIIFAATAARYKETTFDVGREVVLDRVWEDMLLITPNVTMHIVPTIFNGYCKMYEFQQSYKTGSYAGGCILLQFTMYIVVQLMFLLHSRICDSEGQIISCFLI